MPRTKPSAEQVAEVLRRQVPDATKRAIRWREAVTAVRVGLRTTKAFAESWLYDAAKDNPLVVAMTYTGNKGYMTGCVQPNKGRWPKLGDHVRGGWHEAGYEVDAYTSTYITTTGYWISDKDRRALKDNDSRIPREDAAYIVLPEAARHLFDQAQRQRDAEAVVRQAEHTVEQAVVDREHGGAIRYIKALLNESGLDERRLRRALDVGVVDVGDHSVSLTVHLYDSEIDRLADLIKRLGITAGD
jgi:hypothetical protein